jgi:hypothetical protein
VQTLKRTPANNTPSRLQTPHLKPPPLQTHARTSTPAHTHCQGSKPKGTPLPLSGARVRQLDRDDGGDDEALFCISTLRKEWVVRAADAGAKREWTQALEHAKHRAIKVNMGHAAVGEGEEDSDKVSAPAAVYLLAPAGSPCRRPSHAHAMVKPPLPPAAASAPRYSATTQLFAPHFTPPTCARSAHHTPSLSRRGHCWWSSGWPGRSKSRTTRSSACSAAECRWTGLTELVLRAGSVQLAWRDTTRVVRASRATKLELLVLMVSYMRDSD